MSIGPILVDLNACRQGVSGLFEEVVHRETQLLDQCKTFSKTWHFPGRLSTGNGGTGALWHKVLASSSKTAFVY